MWILIMTIVFAGNAGYAGWGGSSVSTAEFNSPNKCRAAGDAWVKSVPQLSNNRSNGAIANYVCVEK